MPRRAVAAIARWVYAEPYRTVPMAHRIDLDPDPVARSPISWVHEKRTHQIVARAEGPAEELEPGTEAEFITEHYWGYGRRRDGTTLEYRVDHPPWRVWDATFAEYRAPNDAGMYGEAFDEILRGTPRSAFIALGSGVAVHHGRLHRDGVRGRVLARSLLGGDGGRANPSCRGAPGERGCPSRCPQRSRVGNLREADVVNLPPLQEEWR